MRLNLFDRKKDKKSDLKKIRWNKDIPAIVYSSKKAEKPENVYLKGDEFSAILRKIKKGHLSTTVFEIEHNKKKYKAIIKEIQYHKVKYDIIHLDFLKVDPETNINVNIPIELEGQIECVGIKAGGVLRQNIKKMKVKCLFKDMPDFLKLDVSDLGMYQSKKLKDISIPSSLTPKAKLKEVVASISKK